MRETRSQREGLSEAFHLRLVHGNDLDICKVLSGPILLDNLSSVPLPTVLFLTNRYRDHLKMNTKIFLMRNPSRSRLSEVRSGPGPGHFSWTWTWPSRFGPVISWTWTWTSLD